MNSQQIEYFLEVVRQGSFTKAAQVCYTTQPSLSRQISKLEEELGVSLFVRTRTGSELSTAGRRYFEAFSEMQKTLALIKAETDCRDEIQDIPVRIGIPEGWDIQELAEKLIEESREDGFDPTFSSFAYQELLSGLKNDMLDFIICPTGLVHAFDSIRHSDLRPLKNIILYSAKHRSPENGREYTIADFRNETLLMLEQREDLTHGIYQQGFLHRLGILPHVKEYRNMDSILLDVSLDKGFAVMDLWSRGIDGKGVKYLVLEQDMPLCIAWHSHKQIQKFMPVIELIQSISKDIS